MCIANKCETLIYEKPLLEFNCMQRTCFVESPRSTEVRLFLTGGQTRLDPVSAAEKVFDLINLYHLQYLEVTNGKK